MKNKIDSATIELNEYLQDFEKNIEETTKQLANITNQCENGKLIDYEQFNPWNGDLIFLQLFRLHNNPSHF